MTKKVVVRFLDENDNTHALKFKIYSSGLANRWLDLIIANQANGNSIGSAFMNQTEQDFRVLMIEMNCITSVINNSYDRILPYFENESFLDQDVLNSLHEEYEIYGDRIEDLKNSEKFDESVHAGFLRLNEIIHSCELIIKNSKRDFNSMSLLVDYYPQVLFEKITDIDKLYLQTSITWGKLYLGYNTLGKDWLEVFDHDDRDVIVRDQVRPQRRFSAETWISFHSDTENLNYITKFEKWYDSLPEQLKQKVPIGNFNELTLGRFEIGSIVINDYFLNFHDNAGDWAIPNHPIKNKWNKEVFSKFRKTLDIEIQ